MTNIKQKKMKINQIFINIKYYERDKEFIIYKISIHSKKMSEDKLKKIV